MAYPFIFISGICLLSLCTSPLCAETQRNHQQQQANILTDKHQPRPVATNIQPKLIIVPVIYKPALRGKPDMTRIVLGGTRSPGYPQNTVHIAVLTPEHVGITSTASPILYWFISTTVDQPLELIITDRQSVMPVLETQLNTPVHAGIQAIKLSDYPLRLQPETEYQWCIRLTSNPETKRQSQDIVSCGDIVYRKAPVGLSQQWNQANPGALPALYAKTGYWYDALTAISSLVNRYPEHQAADEQRTGLLEQVQLNTVISLSETWPSFSHP